ncbi:MAG TPA: phosphatidylserine/phosphatidylglycerophosphate/cardiolipin synthase family protein [Pyrinomonadaceae bacterium]|nr:phosphatidylserine/phosphatidylglycerophosphate/cardiolipin synthase family protein [Pyrinomonadaceae bacterium]
MSISILVDFNEFWTRLSADIRSAQQSVFVQTFAFEGDAIGKQLSAALVSSPAADKRILADSFTRIILSDRFRYSPANCFDQELRNEARATAAMFREIKRAGVKLNFTNAYGVTPRRLLSRNHKKLIVIDDQVAYFGGINFSEHNAAWHDMMLRTDDADAVAFLREDFLSTWTGRDRLGQAQLDGIELFTLDGRHNRAVFQRVLDLIDAARQTIFVESPYITFPFYERLREAARRGVDVKIVTPEQNNWSYFAKYARVESARSQIDLRLYQGGMSHLKAMLIDDEFLIAGSSNFDYLSYRLYQEVVGVITAQEVIAEFRERVMLPDLARSVAVNCDASAVGKHWLSFQTRLLDAALTILT